MFEESRSASFRYYCPLLSRFLILAALLLAVPTLAPAQVQDETCHLACDGWTVQVRPDGSFEIPWIRIASNPVRVTGTCEREGIVLYGQTAYFEVVLGVAVEAPDVIWSPTPWPSILSLSATTANANLTQIGETTQISVTATVSDGTIPDVTPRLQGTRYTSSNPAVASVDTDGLVTAASYGGVRISIENQGVVTTVSVGVFPGTLTAVKGFIIDQDGNFRDGVDVFIPEFGVGTISESDGYFCIAAAPSDMGSFDIVANTGTGLYARLEDVEPIVNGTTDVGLVELSSIVSWLVDADGNWDEPTNWTGGFVPLPDNDVEIDVPGDRRITKNSPSAAVIQGLSSQERFDLVGGSLSVASPISIDNVFRIGGATLVDSTVNPSLGGEPIEVIGPATIENVALRTTILNTYPPWFLSVRNGLQLDGGQILLWPSAGVQFDGSQVVSGTSGLLTKVYAHADPGISLLLTAGTTLTMDPGVDVTGGNLIVGAAGTSLINRGTIRSDQRHNIYDYPIPLTVQCDNWQNEGVMEAAGGELVLAGSSWLNTGTITATNQGRVSINATGAWQNNGTLNVTNSELYLGGAFTFSQLGTYSVASGLIRLNSATLTNDLVDITSQPVPWQIVHSTLTGSEVRGPGTLAQVGDPIYGISVTTFDDVLVNADMVLSGSGTLQLTNGLELNGQITVSPSSRIFALASHTITGNGTFRGLDSRVSAGRIDAGGNTLTLGPTVTVLGGNLDMGEPSGQIVNEGTIRCFQQRITIFGPLENRGLVEVVGGSIMLHTSPVSITQTDGIFRVDVNGVEDFGAGKGLDIVGGILTGIGQVNVPVTCGEGGQVQPGGSPGIFTIADDAYVQVTDNGNGPGTLVIEIGGLGAGTGHDQLAMIGTLGTATLAGTLNATLINAFTPQVGDTFTILTANSVSGTFDTLDLPVLGTGTWNVQYNATSVVLEVLP